MAFDGKSNVRFVDFSKEPLGWPSSDEERLIDISTVTTSNSFQGLLSDDSSSGPAAAINNPMGERTLMIPDNVDFTFSNMGALSEMGFGGLEYDLPNTSISVHDHDETGTPFPSTSICIENPEGIRVPFQTTSYAQIFEPSNPKLDNEPSSTRPQYNPHTTVGSPYVTPRQSNTPTDNHISSSPNSINSADCMAVDYMEALRINSKVGLAPTSVIHDELSRNSLSPDPEYVTGDLSLYNDKFSMFQNPMANTSPSEISSSSPSTSDYLDLPLPSGNSPIFSNFTSSANEFSYDTHQGELTPFLDLQTEQLSGIMASDLSFSSGYSVHPRLESNGGMDVADSMAARNEGPIVSISRSFRHRAQASPNNNDNNLPNSKYSPLIPNPVSQARPLIPIPVSQTLPYTSSLSPNSTSERTPHSSPTVHSNISNNNFQIGEKLHVSEDRPFMKTPLEASVRLGPIKPILLKPFLKRRDQKKAMAEGASAPEAPIRRSKSSQTQRQPKRTYFRPICPSPISYQKRVKSLSPSSSPSAVEFPPRANPPQSPVLPSITSSVPSDTSIISTVSNGRAEYLSEILFNKIAPTSGGVEVANCITGVAFSELKQLQFGLNPVSEILEDWGSNPFSDLDRMTELSVLIEWSFSSGLKENNQLHPIVKQDRPINNLRRVDILCKVARKLYEYIQKEAAIPLDPKKLCMLSLCQRMDKKWIVRIGLNNSQRD